MRLNGILGVLSLSSISVRMRIVILALIPLAGFAANGFTFISGEEEVSHAFQSVRDSRALADASRDFKIAVAAMRIAVKEFADHPQDMYIDGFEQSHRAANRNLDKISASIGGMRSDDIKTLHGGLNDLKKNFEKLIAEQKALGFDKSEGLQSELAAAAGKLKSSIDDRVKSLPEAEGQRFVIALQTVRQRQTDYQLDPQESTLKQFLADYRQLKKTLGNDAAGNNQGIEKEAKSYADTFQRWIDASGNVNRLRALIDIDSQNMLPLADAIRMSASGADLRATRSFSSSQQGTRNGILIVGIATVALGLVLSWLIGRSIARPLNELAVAMKQLAGGNLQANIPATRASDEIGAMARTVIVFRDTMVEREKLAASQAETAKQQVLRSNTVSQHIARFRHAIRSALDKLRAASSKLETNSGDLNEVADTVSSEALTAADRVTETSDNVSIAARSVDELVVSIGEIASQATKSSDVAGRAVTEAKRTIATMTELSEAASRIGEIVGLIQNIAKRTNLLSLNATIESSRAGKAGKGFSVVAQEVKSLAAQTTEATQEISKQIESIQFATANSAQAIEHVDRIISEVFAIATAMASIAEQQNSVAMSIADGVSRASGEARTGAEAVNRIAEVSTSARSTAVDVKGLAFTVASEAEQLEAEVQQFLDNVQAS